MKLHIETTGSGPKRIAFVHGLGNDGTVWNDLIRCAATSGAYTLVTVDLRGHGRSDRASSYRLDDFADDLVESLPTGLDGIVSHSLGGAVVVRAIDRLVPASAVYLDPGFKLALPDAGLGGFLVRRVRWSIPVFAAAARRGVRTPALTPERAAIERASQARWDRRMALSVLQDVATHPYLVPVPVPRSTVVLSGDAPYVVPDPLPAALEAAGWRVIHENSVGHAMFLENPELVWRLIEPTL
ncbi:alpha/beta fold hydrolase [Microbacterium thalli]|uniref:alpha/beta fold hydrolase n=1 Tax=Microbacterium thalli TaxID=3027921 RepID=UPI002366745F|nr:alpha/beta hydrolase [Microbacterium thalli]MDD7928249.1 alpha/beta hydrolase [Microbacterium thalli]